MNPYLYVPAIISILLGLYIYRGEKEGANLKDAQFEGLGKFRGVTWFLLMILGIVIMVIATA